MRFTIRLERRLIMFLLARLFVDMDWGVIAPVVIFGLAGRWDLWNVWAYAGISVVLLAFQTLAIYRQSPDLLKDRMTKTGGRVRFTADYASVVLAILQWIIAGLDQRFHWSDIVPLAGVVAGLVI